MGGGRRGRQTRTVYGLKAAFAAAVVVVAGAAAAGAAGGSGSHAPAGSVSQSWSRARRSACGTAVRGRLAYGYPVKPFRRQHPIRGAFGDPRTLVDESPFGRDTSESSGSFSFHNGVDIVAPTGTPVYPVVSGIAERGYGDEVIVATADGRRFQYFHIHPLVAPGRHVVAYRTVLGRVLPHWLHVHLSEIDGFRIHNPADPGHLEPYVDRTIPTVDDLDVTTGKGDALSPSHLHGEVLVSARAQDEPPLPVPGVWYGFPVTPALVKWRIVAADGSVVRPWQVAADFRHTEPPNRDFWKVYGAGTYQNFPVFGDHYFYRRPGRYIFNLTKERLDTKLLRNGDYVVAVKAADVCGNVGTLREWVTVHN